MTRGFLLDTNIPSELTRPAPDARVTTWVGAQEIASLFLAPSLAERFACGPSLSLGRRSTWVLGTWQHLMVEQL